MSIWGRLSWMLVAISLVGMFLARFVFGGWHVLVLVPLVAFFVGFFLAIIIDFSYYWDFLKLKSTKEGLSTGALAFIVLVLMVSLNFLSVLYDFKIDLTKDKLNTLSEQTSQFLDTLNDNIEFKVFYTPNQEEHKQSVGESIGKFQSVSRNITVELVNIYVKQAIAAQYLKDIPSKEDIIVFAEKGAQRVRVEFPFQEAQIMSALIALTRAEEKLIYFLQGHGEVGLGAMSGQGLDSFRQSLEAFSLTVNTLNLIKEKAIPKDISVLAIIGPQVALLEGEMEIIRRYMISGGRLFLAIDPGLKHHMAQLTKFLGVEFKNNYIMNDQLQLSGRGPATVLGLIYSKNHPVTATFSGNEFTLFDLVSELAPYDSSGLKVEKLVESTNESYSVYDVEKVYQISPDQRGPQLIGVVSSGVLPYTLQQKEEMKKGSNTDGEAWAKAKGKTKGKVNTKGDSERPSLSGGSVKPVGPVRKKFEAIIFGDSDFLTSQSYDQGLNRVLAVNSISYLSQGNEDLLSIPPKIPRRSEVVLTSVNHSVMLLAGVSVPLIFYFLVIWSWFKSRRE